MSPLTAVSLGAQAVNRVKRMWLVYWLCTALFAVVAVAPLAALLARSLGHSLYAERLFANFDPQWLGEFFFETRGWLAAAAAPFVALLALAFLLLNTFLAGGALTIFAAGDAWRPDAFYQGCGRNFGRLFRLLLFSLVLYAAVLALNTGLQMIPRKIWGGGMEERPIVIFNLFRVAFVFALLLLVNMIFDYAKIRLVVEDSRKAVRAALASVALVRRNAGRTAATYALVSIIALALLAAYRGISELAPRSGIGWLLLVLIVQQAFVLSRIWVKLLFFSSQLEMYRKIASPPAVAPPQPEPAAENQRPVTNRDPLPE